MSTNTAPLNGSVLFGCSWCCYTRMQTGRLTDRKEMAQEQYLFTDRSESCRVFSQTSCFSVCCEMKMPSHLSDSVLSKTNTKMITLLSYFIFVICCEADEMGICKLGPCRYYRKSRRWGQSVFMCVYNSLPPSD